MREFRTHLKIVLKTNKQKKQQMLGKEANIT